MLELETAQERILSLVQPLASEVIPLSSAAGRFVAETVISRIALPPFDNSAMDGYAVRAEDVGKASLEQPVSLRVLGRVAAGENSTDQVSTGTCVRLFTGSPLPRGADAVVMQEDTRPDAADPSVISVLDPVRPWENIRLRGEDVKAGSRLAEPGDQITSGLTGLFGATGLAEMKVTKRPLIALIATGNELRQAGGELLPGQIYESNRLTLATLVEQTGARAKTFPIAPDDLTATKRLLEQALNECDAVITAGGVSVGEFDFVKSAFEKLGGKLDFWRVAIRPGKPFVCGTYRDKFFFGLPGNPVSAFVTFLLLVRPALLRLQGAKNVMLPAHPGTLQEPLANRGDRRHFVRVVVDAKGGVRSAGVQASHALSSLACANGLVDVPAGSTFHSGQTVRVLRW